MKFAVTVISPPGYAHSAAFQEVAESIHHALLALGHDSIITQRTDYPERQHIVLGTCTLPHFPQELAPGSILYNLEQISSDSPWLAPDLMALFRRYPLWDYSRRNIEQFRRMGIDGVAHVPLGYVPQLTRIDPADEDIDVLFIGSMNERRLAIIEALRERGVRAEWRFGLYGAERDRLIARARIALNVHYYDAKIFEAVRVSYLLANKRFVISERGSSPEDDEEYVAGVVFAAYDELVDTCLDYLARPERRAEIAAAGFAMMRGRPQAPLLARVIDRIGATAGSAAPAAAMEETPERELFRFPVSIIIPLYNGVGYTTRCLTSLVEHTPDESYELVLIDNGSTDGTSTLLDQLAGDVVIIRNAENKGFAAACNQGARAASGRILVFLNSDTEALAGWLDPLLAALDNPAVGAAGARLLYPDGRLQHAGVEMVQDEHEPAILDGQHRFAGMPADYGPANVRADVAAVTGAALSIRRDDYISVGGFDEAYWNGNEDLDLCFRLAERGLRTVYEPASTLIHHESVSGSERWRRVSDNRLRLTARWRGTVAPALLRGRDGSLRRIVPGESVAASQGSDCVIEHGGVDSEETAHNAILAHRRVLQAIETIAEQRLACGDIEQALRLSRAGADLAWYNHAGKFVSHELEAVTSAAGRRLLADLPDWAPMLTGQRRILHVLTETYAVGGHTRLAWRWMTNDIDSEHSAVLTGSGKGVPDALAAAASGGLHSLSAPTLAERTVELAMLMRQFDLVVLHIHPFDAVAVAACADPAKRPPTLLVNHADHVFWLGVSAADAIMEGRPSGEALTRSRRGVAGDRCVRLPLPLDRTRRTLDREEAKRRLGLSPDAVVLLTIAAPHKYAPAGRAVFSDLAARLLAGHDDAHLIAIGPTAETPGWAALAAAVPGRVHALGYRTDIQAFLEATDVYLDSFPFTSPTSLLEAAQLDTPVVAFAGEPAADTLTGRDFVEPSLVAANAGEWLTLAGTLIGDAEARREQGRRLGERVRSAHVAPGWNRQLATTYARVRHGAAEPPAPVTEVLTPMDDLLYLLHERGGMARTLDAVLRAHGLSISTTPGEAHAASTETPSLSVVVLARNGVAMTIVCLQALLDACAPYGQLDVSVIDHATTDTTREMLATLADAVRIIRVDNSASPQRLLWATGAANARSDRVLLITHDVELDAASAERLFSALANGPGPVGYLGSVDEPGSTCLLYRRAQLTGKVWPSPRYIPIDEEEEVA